MNRYARDAHEAIAFARMATARHRATTANARHCPTCEGCTGYGRFEQEKVTCRELRRDGTCQKRVFLMIELVRAGATAREALDVAMKIRDVEVGMLEVGNE